MEFRETNLIGALIITPKKFEDYRGCFFESYRREEFNSVGLPIEFVQESVSVSKKGVLRGLHFQRPPYAQGKLIRVAHGAIKDVIVDIRKGSRTYGKWQSFYLDDKKSEMLWVPEGFAHGFLALEDKTIFEYKLTQKYTPHAESGIIWNDPDLKIDWGINFPELSEKDKKNPRLSDL